MNKIIAYEVDMQNDFMTEEGGRLYVPQAQSIKPNIADIVRIIKNKGIRRVHSRDRHFKDDPELARNGGPFNDHCMDKQYKQPNMDGTYGIDFIPELQAQPRYVIENKIAEGNNFRTYNQQQLNAIANAQGDIAVEKQHYDIFTNPAVKPLFETMGVEQAIFYGVATEYCVKAVVIGAQNMGIQAYVMKNAIMGITEAETQNAIAEMKQAGAKFITNLEEVLR